MNWGELWDFPFEADIWSSVWSGVGAIGTTSAVGITAYFYFRDQAEKNAAQARLVRFTMEGSGIASRYEITNNSDSSIYDVMLWWDPPLTLRDMFVRKWGTYGVKHWMGDLSPELHSDENILRNFREMPNRTKIGKWDRMDAHAGQKDDVPSTCDVSIGGPLYIEFRDAGGRHWYKEPDKEPVVSRSSWLEQRRRKFLIARKGAAARVRARHRARRVLRSEAERLNKLNQRKTG